MTHKIAFLFAGQGAQYPGMGKELAEASQAAAAVFADADKIRPNTTTQCFEGTQEELNRTIHTQPCLFCTDLAAAKAMEEEGIHPEAVAGFSLGEIAALTFAGVMDFDTGFSFVCHRGEAMDQAATQQPSSMAAVLKLSNSAVEELTAQFDQVYPVNYNCPGQLVVAGEPEQLEQFSQRVKEQKGKAVPLAVSGGFHSPFMNPAAEILRERLERMPLKPSKIPVYANLTGEPYPKTAAEIADMMARQVNHPVLWQKTLEAMWANGIDTFIEVGPGKTLAGFVKKTLPEARVFGVHDAESLQSVLQQMKEEGEYGN